ncbi:MAG TPA: hypothetical protein VGO93_13895 [Candidatus Xenobia bacterium]|jgi:hypothetical protein
MSTKKWFAGCFEVFLWLVMAAAVTAAPLTGRLLRGRQPSDFTTLTADQDRRVVMLMDDDGIRALEGLNGHDKLIRIGYTPDYIAQSLQAGDRYKLAVWPRGTREKSATWDNVLTMVEHAYPEVAGQVAAQRAGLKSHDFLAIERMGGYSFTSLDPSDPRYMTVKRLHAASGSLVEVRDFLYHVVHLRELFTGQGYTLQADGRRGVAEYIMPNVRLAQIPGLRLTDIEIVNKKTTR